MSRVSSQGVFIGTAPFGVFLAVASAQLWAVTLPFLAVPTLWVYPPLCHSANPSEGRTDGTMDQGPFRADAMAEPEPGRGDPAAGATAVPSDAERGSGADSLLGS